MRSTVLVIFPFALIFIPVGTFLTLLFPDDPLTGICTFTATQNSPSKVLLMLIGRPGKVIRTSDVRALGPVSQNFRILLAMNSETRTNDPSRPTDVPPAPERFLSKTETCWVALSNFRSLPVASPVSIASWIWLQWVYHNCERSFQFEML